MTSFISTRIAAAVKKSIPLEINIYRIKTEGHYWKQFWEKIPENAQIVVGIDAHSLSDFERRYEQAQSLVMRSGISKS